MEAECYSPGFIRTELKAGKFVSTCSLLISFSGLGKQSFSDSKNAFVPVVPHIQHKWHPRCSWVDTTFWTCSVRLFTFIPFPVPSWPERGSGWLRVLWPHHYTGGKMLETDLGCPNTIWKDQLRQEAGEMGHILIQAPLDSQRIIFEITLSNRVTLLMAFRSCPPLQHMYKCGWWLLTSYPNVCLICCF